MPKIAAGATNKNISIAPHGTGKVVVGTGAADATLQSDGDFNLVLKTGNSTTGKIEIVDGANGNIDITPNGTGEVDIPKVDIDGGAVDGITLGTNSAVTEAQIDNINIDGNAITSTDTNGNIDLTPAGTGEVNISKVDIDGGAIDATDVTVGSGKTLDVSAGTLTSSTAQKQAIVDGASIEGTDILSTGETGKFLGADGDDSSSWQTIGGTLPSQTGNAEKILKTSGSAASWTATRKLIASTDGIQRSDATAVLSEDGSNVATLDNVTLGSSAVFPAGKINNVFRFSDSTSGTISVATGTITVVTDAKAFSAVSGRHYIVTGMQGMTAYRSAGTLPHRYVTASLYYGTADKAVNDTTSLGTSLFSVDLGRMLIAAHTDAATSYEVFAYNAWFTAASTATHYVYTAASTVNGNVTSNSYNTAAAPHHTIIYEVMP